LAWASGHLDAALGHDAQAGVLDHGIDGAGQVTPRGVGLDDREGTLNGHEGFLKLQVMELRRL
jgi:hypothetical protein